MPPNVRRERGYRPGLRTGLSPELHAPGKLAGRVELSCESYPIAWRGYLPRAADAGDSLAVAPYALRTGGKARERRWPPDTRSPRSSQQPAAGFRFRPDCPHPARGVLVGERDRRAHLRLRRGAMRVPGLRGAARLTCVSELSARGRQDRVSLARETAAAM